MASLNQEQTRDTGGKAAAKPCEHPGAGGWRGGGSVQPSPGSYWLLFSYFKRGNKKRNTPTSCPVPTALGFVPLLGLGSGTQQHRGGLSTAPRIQPQLLGKGLD